MGCGKRHPAPFFFHCFPSLFFLFILFILFFYEDARPEKNVCGAQISAQIRGSVYENQNQNFKNVHIFYVSENVAPGHISMFENRP